MRRACAVQARRRWRASRSRLDCALFALRTARPRDYTRRMAIIPQTSVASFQARRAALLQRISTPVLLAAGAPLSRNYPANTYPFRASSHFLYFIGCSIPHAALLLADGKTTLFVEPEQPGEALWSGPRPTMQQLKEQHGVDAVRPLNEVDAALAGRAASTACLPTQDPHSSAWLSSRLGRPVKAGSAAALTHEPDVALAEAMIALRLRHDEAALAQIRAAADVAALAHRAGMAATRGAKSEETIYGAMMGVLRAHGCDDPYGPIVSIHGEVLHNERHDRPVQAGALLLADVGAETAEGWASDITRTWPVSGTFSATQRAVYEVVLAVQKKAVSMVRRGVRYRHIHETAGRVMLEGLRDLNIVRGEIDGLYERGASTLFLPHGIGHLLGLDVHDMEDLGDRAGYAPGRTRPTRFGDAYLRMDRDLEPNMIVTIEPGFYQVPAILNDERFTAPLGQDLRRDVLACFADVRGIRIEDDVRVTESEPEVLTSRVPKEAAEVERVVRGEYLAG